jgi:hypothetical protein
MSQDPSINPFYGSKPVSLHGIPRVKRYLRLMFFSGPKLLLTSRISGKCALIMMIMCMPALLFSFILTVPGMVFQSPYQHAYFYFSQVINEDPTRWIVLLLAGVCALMSLAVPATLTEPKAPIRY